LDNRFSIYLKPVSVKSQTRHPKIASDGLAKIGIRGNAMLYRRNRRILYNIVGALRRARLEAKPAVMGSPQTKTTGLVEVASSGAIESPTSPKTIQVLSRPCATSVLVFFSHKGLRRCTPLGANCRKL
jgi:hypothetical protein